MENKENRELIQAFRDATAEIAFAALDQQMQLDAKVSREDLVKFKEKMDKRFQIMKIAIKALEEQRRAQDETDAAEAEEAPLRRPTYEHP